MPSSAVRSEAGRVVRPPLRRVAAVLSGLVAALYLLIATGVLSVGEADVGELGILGVAAAVFGVLAVLLWLAASRLLWAGAAVLQVLVVWAYVTIAPERNPPYEVWGVSIRVLQVALLGVLVVLLVRAARRVPR